MDALTPGRLSERAPAFEDRPALPAEAPLAMPVQDLRASPASPRPARRQPGMALRRAVVIGGAGVLALVAGNEMHRALEVGGLTVLEALVLALFVALFAWVALSFTSAIAGFFAFLSAADHAEGGGDLSFVPRSRTALLMPVYNESPGRVAARLQAIFESVAATGSIDRFDFFILSDTTDPDVWIAEEAAFLALRDRTGGHDRIFYRRRARNTERKAGNIADWVRRFGGAYRQMIVLDADSLMTGAAILGLVRAIEADDDVGLVQSLPAVVNGDTLLARAQQFAGRLYGPVIAHGIAWWHGDDGNYWGHNAVIRTEAFAAQAGLPTLAGPRPFGGHIMSHDFVEAALIRRSGWAVRMAPSLGGSYEEGPPSLTDLAVRDRRWCQGNLQHAALLGTRGLSPVSRLHFLVGIGAYVTAPIWLAFLLAGLLIALQARFVRPEYFPSGFALFPQWPAQDPVRAMWVFAATMGILLAPKLLGWLAHALRARDRRGFGGPLRMLAGVLVETVVTALIAPTMMLIQSAGVVAILRGRDGGWHAQRRDAAGVDWADAVQNYGPATAFGAVLGIVAYAVSPPLLLWLSPVVLGLSLAIPVAVLSASPGARALRRIGLLATPEERDPPAVLARANALHHEDGIAQADGLRRLVDDPRLRRLHLATLPAPRRRRDDPIDSDLLVGREKLDDAESLAEVRALLTSRELAAVLADRRSVERMVALAQAVA
ncbi:MAG: glucans biosynthesis glucosyltransferase MdoH [Alphaproteobacteria bacterium]